MNLNILQQGYEEIKINTPETNEKNLINVLQEEYSCPVIKITDDELNKKIFNIEVKHRQVYNYISLIHRKRIKLDLE